jgi:hypothetical protein
MVAVRILPADHREAAGEAGILPTKWGPPAQGVVRGGLGFKIILRRYALVTDRGE